MTADLGGPDFSTSLFPRDGGYLLPLKDSVRAPRRIGASDELTVRMTVRLGR